MSSLFYKYGNSPLINASFMCMYLWQYTVLACEKPNGIWMCRLLVTCRDMDMRTCPNLLCLDSLTIVT